MNFKMLMPSLLSLLIVSPAGLAAAQTDESTIVRIGDQAPAFSGDAIDNTRISLSSYAGQIVVLDFFTTW